MGKNAVLKPYLHFYVPGWRERERERLNGATLNTYENLRAKDRMSRSPSDQIWAK